MKKRIIYASCFFVILIIEIIIGVYIHDAFIRPYIGDVLVVILICCFIRIFILRYLLVSLSCFSIFSWPIGQNCQITDLRGLFWGLLLIGKIFYVTRWGALFLGWWSMQNVKQCNAEKQPARLSVIKNGPIGIFEKYDNVTHKV